MDMQLNEHKYNCVQGNYSPRTLVYGDISFVGIFWRSFQQKWPQTTVGQLQCWHTASLTRVSIDGLQLHVQVTGKISK